MLFSEYSFFFFFLTLEVMLSFFNWFLGPNLKVKLHRGQRAVFYQFFFFCRKSGSARTRGSETESVAPFYWKRDGIKLLFVFVFFTFVAISKIKIEPRNQTHSLR